MLNKLFFYLIFFTWKNFLFSNLAWELYSNLFYPLFSWLAFEDSKEIRRFFMTIYSVGRRSNTEGVFCSNSIISVFSWFSTLSFAVFLHVYENCSLSTKKTSLFYASETVNYSPILRSQLFSKPNRELIVHLVALLCHSFGNLFLVRFLRFMISLCFVSVCVSLTFV